METIVNGFSVSEVDNPFKELPFQKIRTFQKDFVDKIKNTDILCLSTPTGAGKTLCFEYLCKKNPPVLLIYPTTALMTDQEKQLNEHGLKVFRLDANSLGEIHGYARSKKLQAFFQQYNIIITNPDIISAVLHHMYINPEDDLMRIFNYFNYIVYDEFHIFRELELSDIILQILLFHSVSTAKIVLSSATPSSELTGILQKIKPDLNIVSLEEKGGKDGQLVRYTTAVKITNEVFKEKVNEIIEKSIENNLKTLVICNSNKFARVLYNSLVQKGHQNYVTKDTGDESRGETKADLSKLIIISTSKSEVGVDYPLDIVIIDVPYDFQSFVQRFGRVSRKKEGSAFVFVKKIFQLDKSMEYYSFIGCIGDYFLEKRIFPNITLTLLEFRTNLVLERYVHISKKLEHIFENIKYKKYYLLGKQLEEAQEKIKNLGVDNNDLREIINFLEDYKTGLSLLRGISITGKINYQRGEDWTFTSYDLLHSLNNYEVQIDKDYITLLEPSDQNKIHSLIYNETEYDFYNFDKQIKGNIKKKCKKLVELDIINKNVSSILSSLLVVDLRRVLLPDEVVLKDGIKINIKDFIKKREINIDTCACQNII